MKKLFTSGFVFLLFLLTCQYAESQPYDPVKVNKKARAYYEQAEQRAADGNLINAAGLLQQAIHTDPGFVEAYLELAGIYGILKNYTGGIQQYEKAFALDSNYTIDYKQPYSVLLAGLGQFDNALEAVNELLAKHPPKNPNATEKLMKRKRSYEFAVDYSIQNPVKNYVFTPKNLGPEINTAESEYFPCESLDGKELVFTRRIRNFNEDFYYSKRANGKWDKARPMDGNVNTPDNEAAQHISQDGQWLVFTANHSGGFGNFDLYISYLSAAGWAEAQNMGRMVNSDQWDSQPCLSPDKRDLYFSSQRLGGFGGKDIYVSHQLPGGSWSFPENLGPGINTAGDDQCPFIHADNQTLYFTSNGWPGYGDNDLFIVRKNAAGNWSKPKNLGFPVNTIHDEGTLFISADGITAYYASDRDDSHGGLDIYSFELREDLRPFKTLWVKGRVYDKKTNAGIPGTVELTDMASKQSITKVQTDETGNYLITLPVGKDYAFNVNRKGYLFFSDNFFLEGRSPDSTYEKNIPLQPIEVNAREVLKNVFFNVGRFELNPTSQAELDILVQLLLDNPVLRIEISGHTDNVGKPADNLLLSNNRARSVVNYLISKNVAASRLIAKGYGEMQPVAPNTSEEGRARNRRTEMKVLSN